MKRLFAKFLKLIFLKFIGYQNTVTMITSLADLIRIDLLVVAYQSRGILKYSNNIESGEYYFINTVLPKYINSDKHIFFDVGANVGIYSKMLASAFPNVQIYSFEPNPVAYEMLQKKTSNPNINFLRIGLSSNKSRKIIYDYSHQRGSGHSSMYEEVLTDLHGAVSTSQYELCTITLDDFCESQGIDFIDFLKIDTEGHEFDVLKGALRYLETDRIGVIQFEFNEMNIISRVFLRDFYKLLDGYRVYRLDSEKLIQLFDYNTFNEIFKFQNFIAINNKLFPMSNP